MVFVLRACERQGTAYLVDMEVTAEPRKKKKKKTRFPADCARILARARRTRLHYAVLCLVAVSLIHFMVFSSQSSIWWALWGGWVEDDSDVMANFLPLQPWHSFSPRRDGVEGVIGGEEQVMVVGIHHSGTSVVSKVLLAMGYYGGKDNEYLRYRRA